MNYGADLLYWTASTDNVGVVGYNIYANGRYSTSRCCSPNFGGVYQNKLYTGISYTVAAYDMAGNISERSSPVIALSTNSQSSKNNGFATIIRNLSLGSTGDDVKILQALLVNEVGYSADLITGYFGRITREAVKKLQEKYNITPALGYFGEITRQRLQAL